MPITTLDDFSKEASEFSKRELSDLLPNGITKEIGHFNVFDVEAFKLIKERPHMTYNRRAYYKINFVNGRNRVEYGDKTIDIEQHALIFAKPEDIIHLYEQVKKHLST